MALLSIQFPVFFLIILTVYYLVPRKSQWMVLLAGSLLFYSLSGLYGTVVLVSVILVSFFGAQALDRRKSRRSKKILLILTVLLLVTVLFLFKISHAYRDSLQTLFSFRNPFTLFLPLGISYFVLEAIGYCTDVYQGSHSI